MLTMAAERSLLFLAMCFVCVSTNDEQFPHGEPCEEELCETHKLRVTLGTPVLLSCIFGPSNTSWVEWTHNSRGPVLQLTLDGHIMFEDPRHGRVKAFPNQASQGNYSICIDRLKEPDLGCYRCKRGDFCHQMELLRVRSPFDGGVWLLISICVGVAALILLCASIYYCSTKHMELCTRRTEEDAHNPVSNVSGPAGLESNLVYENDDQGPACADPCGIPCDPPGAPQAAAEIQPSQSSNGIYPNLNSEIRLERAESRRTRLRFHRELINRLRQPSVRRHYYVNRDELSKQQAEQTGNPHRGLRKKKARDNCEYTNPIYNRSTDQLNQL